MKYIFQIPIFLLMLWASGVSCATYSVALSGGKVEAYVTNACSPSDPSGGINIEIIGGTGPFDVEIKNSDGRGL